MRVSRILECFGSRPMLKNKEFKGLPVAPAAAYAPRPRTQAISVSEIWTDRDMATSLRLPLRVAFPCAAVEARLRAALATQAADQAVLRDRPTPPPLARPAWEPEIDSLVVVELICAVEEQLGLKLPISFAPRGGYNSADDCVRDLLAKTEAVWN
jgi:acyl carrier protein